MRSLAAHQYAQELLIVPEPLSGPVPSRLASAAVRVGLSFLWISVMESARLRYILHLLPGS